MKHKYKKSGLLMPVDDENAKLIAKAVTELTNEHGEFKYGKVVVMQHPETDEYVFRWLGRFRGAYITTAVGVPPEKMCNMEEIIPWVERYVKHDLDDWADRHG